MVMLIQGSPGPVGIHMHGGLDLPDDVGHVVFGRTAPLSLST